MFSKRIKTEHIDGDLNRSNSATTKSTEAEVSVIIGKDRKKSSFPEKNLSGSFVTENNTLQISHFNTNNNNHQSSLSQKKGFCLEEKSPSTDLPKNNTQYSTALNLRLLQAMQLAYLEHHQGKSLKSESPWNPNDMAANSLTNSTVEFSNQIQQLLSQQVLSPNQLYSHKSHYVMPPQQQQALEMQEIYRQQQKHIQEFQVQLATATEQQQKRSLILPRSDESSVDVSDKLLGNDISKHTQDHEDIRRQLAIQQLLQLQHMQQQHLAATSLQQRGLAAAVAMAQSCQKNCAQPAEASFSGPKQWLKHASESSSGKDVGLAVTNDSGNSVTSTNQTTPAHDRSDMNSQDSVSSECEGSRTTTQHFFGDNTTQSDSLNGFQPLYSDGVCQWPGCSKKCTDASAFSVHIETFHSLNDKTTTQCRVQMQVVEQLEKQLYQEKQILEAMIAHLSTEGNEKRLRVKPHLALTNDTKMELSVPESTSPQISLTNGYLGLSFPFQSSNSTTPSSRRFSNQSLPSSPNSGEQASGFPLFPPTSSPLFPSFLSSTNISLRSKQGVQAAKRRHSAITPISSDLSHNQEFYRNEDVRPPFTYASLIRQAIVEAAEGQLTLNEIYNWFQRKFAYFRRNAPTWKNAVRHNLSLHKCFVRVENVKGAVWTVNEHEYQKRRSQKFSGNSSIGGRDETRRSQSLHGSEVNLTTMQMPISDHSLKAFPAGQSVATVGNNEFSSENFAGRNRFPTEPVELAKQASHFNSRATDETEGKSPPSRHNIQ